MAHQLVVTLCKQFAGRSMIQGYKGKTRDKMAIEFFIGALAATDAMGSSAELAAIQIFTALQIAPCGYSAIERILASNP